MSAEEKDTVQKVEKAVLAHEGKYLTFVLGKEEYGVAILKVQEIIGLMEITQVPQMPPYVKGVINLRGKVIPAIDLRLKFGMEAVAYTGETCIIVLNVNNILMGIIVDKVSEVLDIEAKNIEPTPSFGTTLNTDFILGMGKIGEKVILLLAIEKILTEDMVIAEKIAD